MMPVTMDIRRANARFTTREVGRLTRHQLSFGEHYDPERIRFGPLVCHDEHVLGAGRGFADHHHEDLEILTWVLDGGLDHHDSLGTDRVLRRGTLALLSAGSGVEHREVAASGSACRFVQAWLTPDEPGGGATYSTADLGEAELAGALRVVAAGAGVDHGVDPGVDPGAPLRLRVAGASLAIGRFAAGAVVELPVTATRARRHVLVSAGALLRHSLAEPLAAGDVVELSGEHTERPFVVTTAVPTELMVWTFSEA